MSLTRSSAPQNSESAPQPCVLSVCETALGGVGRYHESLRQLKGRGIDLKILLPDTDAKILEPGKDLLMFRRDRRSMLALVWLAQAFWAARKKLHPDLYLFNSTFALLPLLLLRLAGDTTPAIYCAHCWAINNYNETSLKGRIVRAIEGHLAGLADLVVNVSHGDKKLASRLGYRGRQMVIENAVPERRLATAKEPFKRDNTEDIHLLFVGRFDRQKGLDILLPAFQHARQQNARLRLHLVGDVVRDQALPALPEGVVHHGWCAGDQIDSYYAAADVLVVPSRWEGLPLGVPEALRNGTPVLVANTSDMASLVSTGSTGGVFELDKAALAASLSALDRKTLQAMRPAARESYEQRFAMQRFLDEMSGQINGLLVQGGEK